MSLYIAIEMGKVSIGLGAFICNFLAFLVYSLYVYTFLIVYLSYCTYCPRLS